MVSERNEQYLGWELVLNAINQTRCRTHGIAIHILHLYIVAVQPRTKFLKQVVLRMRILERNIPSVRCIMTVAKHDTFYN